MDRRSFASGLRSTAASIRLLASVPVGLMAVPPVVRGFRRALQMTTQARLHIPSIRMIAPRLILLRRTRGRVGRPEFVVRASEGGLRRVQLAL
jgi:hypothetical protein